MGDGGMVVTDDEEIASWIKKFRNHGMINRDEIDCWGRNYRLQPLQAIVANYGLKKLKNVIKKRNQNAMFLDNILSEQTNKVILPKRRKGYTETFALYMILCEDRDNLLKFLQNSKIEAKVHYPIPLHLQKPSLKQGYKKGDFPVSEEQANKLITLPIHQYLNKNQLNYMAQKIIEFYDSK